MSQPCLPVSKNTLTGGSRSRPALFVALLLGLLVVGLFLTIPAQAQTATRTPTATRTRTPTRVPTRTPTPRSTPTATVTPTATSTATPTVTPTNTPEAPLTGTIIANRTQVDVTFFVDGRTFVLAPLRSASVPVRRDNTVLNLYNCAAQTGGDNAACFWDPYLMRQDGFYEVIDRAGTGGTGGLFLQDAATPPGNQIWLHNRTGQETAVHYSGATYRLSPGSTVEVPLVNGAEVVYLEHCLALGGETVCEWLPAPVVGGVYYAVNRSEQAGGAAGSRRSATDLAPVLAQNATLLAAAASPTAPAAEPSPVGCRLSVPTLNVRAGPGVDFVVLEQLRSGNLGEELVAVVGRTADGGWLAVDESVAVGGWIAGGSQFVTCAGDVAALPVAQVTDGRLIPTPQTQAAQPQPQPAAQPAAQPEAEPAPAPAPQPSDLPPGMARMVVINAFGQDIRFTYLNTEYDMRPGDQVVIDIVPGLIAFSASSAWRNLSGNADFNMLAGESRVLYVRWEQNPETGEWSLKFD